MNYRPLVLIASAVTGLTLAPVAGAYMSMFGSYPGSVSETLANAPAAVALVPMDAAVKAAEHQVTGKAFSADLERTGSGPAYLVEFAGNGANTDVWVDAKSGKVEKTETIRLATLAPGE
ncbi:MAG TPA: PepSY domain-containing protein [Burkholderiales bacterium]|nr:PepSY domain-containing protein [Burkholderiales bacterium]